MEISQLRSGWNDPAKMILSHARDDGTELVLNLALTLTLSPEEREQPSSVFAFPIDRPANPVAGFAEARGT